MPNRRRGEVALQLGETRYTLCLTLGALAELEDAFGVQDLMALAERFGTGRLSRAATCSRCSASRCAAAAMR